MRQLEVCARGKGATRLGIFEFGEKCKLEGFINRNFDLLREVSVAATERKYGRAVKFGAEF